MARIIPRYLLGQLLKFLARRVPCLASRWNDAKQKEMMYHLPPNVVLRKIRGALLDLSKRDMLYGWRSGYFHATPIIDSVIRVIRRRGWANDPDFSGVFDERVRRYEELCNEEDRYDFNEEGRTDSDDHELDDDPRVEDRPNNDRWIDTREPIVRKPCIITISGPSYRYDDESEIDQVVAGPSGVTRSSGVRRLNFDITDSSSSSSSSSSSCSCSSEQEEEEEEEQEEEVSEEEDVRSESDYEEEEDEQNEDEELAGVEWEDDIQEEDEEEVSEADSVHQTGGGGEEWGNILPPGKRFQIISEQARYFRRFKTRGREIILKLRKPPENTDQFSWIQGAMRDVMTHLTASCEPHDYAGVEINSSGFSQGAAWLSFRPVRDFSLEDIWKLINDISQSAREFRIVDDALEIRMCIVRGVQGSGRGGIPLSHEELAKRSILHIDNRDNLCLPRSLVTAYAYAERGELRTGDLHKKWQKIRDGRREYQRSEALKLIQKANVKIPTRGCGLREIKLFQKYFAAGGIAIVVYEFLSFGKRAPALFDGRENIVSEFGHLKHTLFIIYYERSHHFQPILNLVGALGSRGFCSLCNTKYTRTIEHRCSKECSNCKSKECPSNGEPSTHCNECNRSFFGAQCFAFHKLPRTRQVRGCKNKRESSVCEMLKICRKCSRLVKTWSKPAHECGVSFCRTCKRLRPVSHDCFIAPLKIKAFDRRASEGKKNDKPLQFIFYDFETQQHTLLRGDNSSRVHIPNLCVAQRVCLLCLNDEEIENECDACGQREFVFDKDPVGNLVKLAINSKFEKTICLAHNARGFDGQFILRYLIEDQKTQMPTLIMRGTKIISMKVGKICFLDSLNYLPMPLSSLPKAFGFSDIVIKGTFPHLFNIPDNQNYIGPLPALNYYLPEKMFASERERFIEWYEETRQSGYIFNFAEEFLRYCRDDVSVLRRACLAFRKLFIQCGNVCPFSESCTIASACSLVYRRNFLPTDKIALLPPGGYRWADKQSRKAVSWLVWVEREKGIIIQHAGRSREQRLPGGLPPVDGYYEKNGAHHVFQFHGCFWHGCKRCFRINRDKQLRYGQSMDERYERTITISSRIKDQGFLLEEIWECEYDTLIKNNDDMEKFIRNHPMVILPPLEPREAFFGGRTENFVNMYEVKKGEKIRYVDVCSLYPWVCKTGKFPIGHPRVYVGEECRVLVGGTNSLDRVEGLVKCSVLPPRDLYLPVLPFRAHGKLLFALCKSCCLNLNTRETCVHENPNDRAFDGTWVVDELRKAVSLGYSILRIDEIWQYEITRYEPMTRTGGLFAEYINTFLKIKQEASGPPSNAVGNPDSIKEYIEAYEQAEGVTLDAHAIEGNPGLRSLAKLALNSFWGKFGQRENQTNTMIISSRAELMDLLTSPEIEITGILPVNHRIMYVNYKNTDEAIRPSLTANVVIAAYTTAQARLKLYEYLEGLGRRVLYCDTDSCIYVSRGRNDEYEPPTGQFLGDLTDELSAYGDGSYISSFVSGGPKFYAFIVRKPDGTTVEVCKVKGITLNFENSREINYDTIRSFVTGDRNTPVVLNFDAIRRTEFHQVITRKETKSCAPVSVKRQHDGEYFTLPYGFVGTNV